VPKSPRNKNKDWWSSLVLNVGHVSTKLHAVTLHLRSPEPQILPVEVDGVRVNVQMAGCHSCGVHGSCWMQQTTQLQDVAVLCHVW